ncbi:LiaF transmembrane domain-containing protein [Sphingobacterium sp. HJSM2_6]|uniref:LiaF transmembrane domain-containing protein n=1 Tax=Sphingobacterium sp. HJSM2_6 TaxID=3366264 RepID=UPI003BD24852
MTTNKQNMNPEEENKPPKNNNTSTLVGAIIIFLGFALLMKNLDLGNMLPGWFFGWETILIIIGLVIGVNSKFEKKSAHILIGIGLFFFLKNELGLNIAKFIIPAAAIFLGFYLLNRNRNKVPIPPPAPKNDDFDWDKRVDSPFNQSTDTAQDQAKGNYTQEHTSGHRKQHYQNFTPDFENYIKIDNFFSDTKKVILSKNFLGGNITSVFGSTVLNFLQADLKQPVVIDTFQLFGSTKIIVPMNWRVSSNISSIFGEVDDRRPTYEITTDDNKKIYITGTSIFGGLTIKNS